MNKATWTEQQIIALLTCNNRAVERAILAIYDRQTQDEKRSDDTKHDNKIGFSAGDAKKGSYYARWVMSGRNLSRHHLNRARRMAVKYRRQLTEIANQGAA
jgi:hypothetical protein